MLTPSSLCILIGIASIAFGIVMIVYYPEVSISLMEQTNWHWSIRALIFFGWGVIMTILIGWPFYYF